MTDNLKTALDNIRAEDKLKSNTIEFLQQEIQKRKKIQRLAIFKKYIAVLASVAIIILSGVFAYSAYFIPVAYVDLDVNPSIELALNRFDRVIGIHAYNEDGSDIIKDILLKNRSYGEALTLLMEAINQHGYFQDNALISVTFSLETDNKSKEQDLLAGIQTGIEDYMTGHHHASQTQIDVFSVSNDTRNHSHELNLSPAKYLAIQELIEVDPTASVESCRKHSINEIRRLAQERGNHHNSNGNNCHGH